MWQDLKKIVGRIVAWIPVLGMGIFVLQLIAGERELSPSLMVATLIIFLSMVVFLPVLSHPALRLFGRSMPGKDGKPSDVLSGDIFIAAPWKSVWATFGPRPRHNPFQMGVSQIRAVPDAPDLLDLVMDREIVGFDKAYRVRVEVVEPDRFIRLHYMSPQPATMGMRTLSAEYEIHPQEDGTWVRYAEENSFTNPLMRFGIGWLNPVDDMLSSLKAQIEGTPDMTISGVVAQTRLAGGDVDEAIFNMPKFKIIRMALPATAVALTLFLPVFAWALLKIAG